MPTNTTAHDIGDMVRLGIVITTTSGARVNTGMTLLVREPATPTVAAVTTKFGPIATTNSTILDNTTVGTWRHYFKVTKAGRHLYQWLSTGAVTLSTGGAFPVRPRFASTST